MLFEKYLTDYFSPKQGIVYWMVNVDSSGSNFTGSGNGT